MRITEIGEIALYESEVLSKFQNLVHGFTTRKGGVSKGEYESMSLSHFRGDDILCVRENEKILCERLFKTIGYYRLHIVSILRQRVFFINLYS